MHLLLYVILVMVSLFNMRFKNEFDVSAIWNKKREAVVCVGSLGVRGQCD